MTPDERERLESNAKALWAAGIRTAPCRLWEVLQLAKYADAAERDAVGKEWLVQDTLASYHAERERRERAEGEAARLRGLLREVRAEVPEHNDEQGYCYAGCGRYSFRIPEHTPDCLWPRIDAALAAQPGEG